MSLEPITGPMSSGKTLELIRRLDAAAASGSTMLAAKPAFDLDSGFPVSAAGPTRPAHQVDGAETVGSLAARADVVGVDEAQFLAAAEVNRLVRAAAGGTRVIAAGLDLDFRGRCRTGATRRAVAADDGACYLVGWWGIEGACGPGV